jgi:hypothetical protein
MGWTMVIDALPSSNAVVVLVGGIALLVCGMIAIPRTRRIPTDVHEPPVRGRRASHRLP